MLDRREFLAFLGVGVSAAAPAFTFNSSADASADDHMLWVYDESLAVAPRWAESLRRKGLEVLPTSGNPETIYDQLVRAGSAQPRAIAGLTTGIALYATSELAFAYGYRLTRFKSLATFLEDGPPQQLEWGLEGLPSDPASFTEPVLWQLDASGVSFRAKR